MAHASSQRFAEKRRCTARSSSSDVEHRYALIIWPIAVVLSGSMYQERRLGCVGLDAPGNLCSDVSMLSFCNREYRFAVCVVLPERSRPSITIKGARRVLLDIACQYGISIQGKRR